MDKTVISVEHLSKRYALGVIGTGTIRRDLIRWWARFRHNPDPYTRIGEKDHGNHRGGSILALDDVSLKVEQGEVLGIIGHNGAGKSTLLKILSQITAPTSGEIKIRGRIGSLLEVGTGFHSELTGRENVYLNGAILGMTRIEVDRKFDEIVDFSGVIKFIDTPVKRYSSGMMVRLGFAVAAHLDPEILIVDEVLAVGDAEFQKKCLGKMSEVAHEGRTVLFVSHNMGAIHKLCKRAIVFRKGSLVRDGNSEEMVQWYLDDSTPENANTKYHIKSNKPFYISQVHFENSKQQTIINPVSGKLIDIVINYVTKNNQKNIYFGLTIFNHLDVAVTHLNGKSYEELHTLKAGNGQIRCRINRLPLPVGRYRITIAAYGDTGQLDQILNAVAFDVSGSVFFPSSYSPPIEYSSVLLDHEWIN